MLCFQSRIASQLIPSAIFAAVPRTPTNLSQTWPRRTPSPIAHAVSEAGNVGRVVLGDFSNGAMAKRPPAELPSNPGDENSENADGERVYESTYECVREGESYDKTTKYFRMSRRESSSGAGREDLNVEGTTGNGRSARQPFYHILDHEKGEVVEPVYSRVDKKKKSGSKQADEKEKEEVLPVKHSYSLILINL